jgi:DNA-binding MarR family transcriptional regulator
MSSKSVKPRKTGLQLDEYVPGLLLWLSNKLSAGASQAYLSYLAVYGWSTGAQMSQLMGTDKAAISRGAAFLLEKGHIKSRNGFGRNLEFGLTAKGQQLHDRVMPLALARQKALLSGLNKKDIAKLLILLHALLKNLPAVEAVPSDDF